MPAGHTTADVTEDTFKDNNVQIRKKTPRAPIQAVFMDDDTIVAICAGKTLAQQQRTKTGSTASHKDPSV